MLHLAGAGHARGSRLVIVVFIVVFIFIFISTFIVTRGRTRPATLD